MRKRTISFILILCFVISFCFVNSGKKMNINNENEIKNENSLIGLDTADFNGGGYLMNTSANFDWIEINSTGTLMSIFEENISFSEGWNFTFYGEEFDEIYHEGYGYFTFLQNSENHVEIPAVSSENENLIALLSTGLEITPGIYYEFLTGPNRLVIEFFNVSGKEDMGWETITSHLGSFEIILYESGTIKFQYKEVNETTLASSPHPTTIGLDHGDLTNFNLFEPTEPLIGKAIEFTPEPLIPVDFNFSVEPEEEIIWMVTNVDQKNMTDIFGSDWYDQLGFNTIPNDLEKMKINITENSENGTHLFLNYDTWDFINKDNQFLLSNDSLNQSYAKNPEENVFFALYPLIVPNPGALYLYKASLPYSNNIYFNRITGEFQIIDSGGMDYEIRIMYDANGVLERLSIILCDWSLPYFEKNIFNFIRYHDGPKPSYVGVNEGDIYEYDPFFDSEVFIYSDPNRMFERMRIEIDAISGEDTINGRTLIAFHTTILINDTWFPYSSNVHSYVYNDSRFGSLGQPLFSNNKMDWNEFTENMRQDPLFVNSDNVFESLEDGFAVEWNYTYPIFCTIRIEYRYTSNGILAIECDYNNSQLGYSLILDTQPTANFTSDKTSIKPNEEVAFIFTGSEGNTPTSYYWDFGDGENSTERDPVHTYKNIGSYSVSLMVMDSDGEFDFIILTNYIFVKVDDSTIIGFDLLLILSLVSVSTIVLINKIRKSK